MYQYKLPAICIQNYSFNKYPIFLYKFYMF
jgi:hypothetical protein